MASEDEIEEVVTKARSAGFDAIILFHYSIAYPNSTDQANLRQMPELAKRFGMLPRLSDHALGIMASGGRRSA